MAIFPDADLTFRMIAMGESQSRGRLMTVFMEGDVSDSGKRVRLYSETD